MTAQGATPINPYIGPRAFEERDGSRFFGREREVDELFHLLLARRLLLLHSPSGAGKSSLIHAGLAPRLRDEGFAVYPTIRLLGSPPPGVNRFVYATLLSLDEERSEAERLGPEALAGLSIPEYLARRPQPDTEELFIFDQFEEVLSLDPADRAPKQAFFTQLGAVLEDPRRWALFAIREDYLGALRPYLLPIPTRLAATYRLDLLNLAQGRQAIQRPMRLSGGSFSDAAAQQLVDDLSRTVVQQPNGSSEVVPGNTIEPVQLQVVCYRLWERSAARGGPTVVIDVDDISATGSVDEALARYYAERVAAAAQAGGVSERQVRDWIGGELITSTNLRGQVLRQPGRTADLPNEAIQVLVNAHLLRADERRNAIWYELAHDRLIQPIRKDNLAWFSANLSPLQRQAELWAREGRREGLLAAGAELAAFEAWAAGVTLTEDERDFLDRSRKEQDDREREALNVRRIVAQSVRIRRLGVVLAFAALAALALALLAFERSREAQLQAENARAQARIAQVRQLSAQAIGEREAVPQKALLLAVEAVRRAPADGVGVAEVALREVLASVGGLPLAGHHQALSAAAFSPDGRWLVTVSGDSTVRLWPVAEGEPAVLRAHTAAVNVLAFSPDGRWLASGGEDNATVVWSLADLRAPAMVLRDHRLGVRALAFSPDGATLASGSFDRTVRLYRLATPEPPLAVLDGHMGAVRSLAFSPDGATLASASEDTTVRLWSAAAPHSLLAELVGHSAAVGRVAFSPDGELVASASDDFSVQLWQPSAPSQPYATLRGHEDAVVDLAFSPDGRLLATAGKDRRALLWQRDAFDAPPTGLQGHGAGLTDLAFSPDGQWLATAADDGTARLWALAAGVGAPLVLRGHEGAVLGVTFHPDSRLLATSGADAEARLWDVSSAAASPAVLGRHTYGVTQVAFDPQRSQLATAGYDNLIRLWRAQANPGPPVVAGPGDSSTLALALSPDGRWAAAASSAGPVQLWPLDPAHPTPRELAPADGQVAALGFSPDGSRLAGAGSDGTVWVWSVESAEQPPAALVGQTGFAFDIEFSPDGRWLATASGTAVQLWALGGPGSRPIWTGQHEREVLSLAFSPDSRLLVSGDGDGTARLWQVAAPDGAPATMTGHSGAIMATAFSPDGRFIVTGSVDGSAILWSPEAPAMPAAYLAGHDGPVAAVAFNSDSSALATGDSAGTLRLWSPEATAAPRLVMRAHSLAINTIAFSPDGRWFVTGSGDETARLWPARRDDLLAQACAVAGRNLSLLEWQAHIDAAPDSYTTTCPQHPPDRSLFLAMLRDGAMEEAIARYAEARAVVPQQESVEAWLVRLGAELMGQGQQELAIAALERAIAENPELPLVDGATFNSYCIYAAPENVRRLGVACEQAAERAPDNGNYAYNRARARAMLGNYSGAITDLRFFLEWAPGHPDDSGAMTRADGWIAELAAGRSPFGSAPPAP